MRDGSRKRISKSFFLLLLIMSGSTNIITRFFCTHCKRSFRPRVSRSSTRVTPARNAKKGFNYDDDEEEDEEDDDDQDEGEEKEEGEDSDFDSDVSPVAPDVDSNNPYYRFVIITSYLTRV